MLLRAIRLSERYAHLLTRAAAILSGSILLFYARLGDQVSRRFRVVGQSDTPDHRSAGPLSRSGETQIRALSGMTLFLLVIVVILVLWATTGGQSSNPVIQSVSSLFQAADEDVGGQSNTDLNQSTGEDQRRTGTVVFTMQNGASTDIYALAAGANTPVRLSDSAADDRDPAWSPDGGRIAFTSHRDGNWDLYILEMSTGTVTRLTEDLAFEAGPTWSPDGQWLAYETYSAGNLDIALIKTDGSEGPLLLTRHPSADFAPDWITDEAGRFIAFVSLRDGSKDIFLVSLDEPDRQINLTNSGSIQEDEPAWDPTGTLLAYSAMENGLSLVNVLDITDPLRPPVVIGQGTSPAWSPDGGNLVFLGQRRNGSLLLAGQLDAWETSVQTFALPAYADNLDWSFAAIPESPRGSLAFSITAPPGVAYSETLAEEGPPYLLRSLPEVTSEKPWLSDRVDASFLALRETVERQAGWDFLGRLDNVFWALDRRVEPGESFRSWHKTGRAFAIVQSYNQGTPAQVEVVIDPRSTEVYWNLFVRASVQDGTLGEPLRDIPWDFYARTGGDPDAYEDGGTLKPAIPGGYYVDFTATARVYGWEPVASDSAWNYNWPSIRYWQYVKTDGLDWLTAASEIYPPGALEEVFGTSTGGIPSPVTPTLLPPATIETEETLSATPTSGNDKQDSN